jgi:uncharacterized membrane protein SirB2
LSTLWNFQKWLVLFHVLTAIIGVGPTFFGHVLLRRKQNLQQLRSSLEVGKFLEPFPKIGGTLALLSGFALVIFYDYGSFVQTLWQIGALVIYALIQITVIGFASPSQKKLSQWVLDASNYSAQELPLEQQSLFKRANVCFWVASSLGTLLFIFMILKPTI